jgi:DNA-binding response OmpR family regulator
VPAFVLTSFELDEITLDPTTRTVTVAGQEPRRLTHLEFRLLYVLMTNRDQVVPTEVIVERVWGYDGSGDRELVRGLISRLRRKIEPDPEQPRFVQNITGVGYLFTLENQAP